MSSAVDTDGTRPAAERTTPELWGASFVQPQVLSSEATAWRSALVRRWAGGDGVVSQPLMDHHYVVLHLGGPKRVTRYGDGPAVTADVTAGALTLVPAGTRYEWVTEGPIDFAHLYVHPARLNSVIASRFDRDPSSVTLPDKVGFEDPLLSAVMIEMLEQVGRGTQAAATFLDELFELALTDLAHKHSSLDASASPARLALAPVRLRRVLDLVDRRLGEALALADMAEAAGLSRFHSRAFGQAMGEPPMAYVNRRRVEVAKKLLRGTDDPMAAIARRCGLGSASQFATTFRNRTGRTPSDYRRSL